MSPQDKCVLSFYKDLEPIGEGGKVMLVRHIETGQVFVKKRLPGYNRELYRFLRGRHFPGTPKVCECLDDDAFIVVIEEYVGGQTLRQYMKEKGLIGEEEAKRIIGQLCDTLGRLHSAERPIVCRDLKPENIVLSANQLPVIVDFDAARFMHTADRDTILLGSPGYAAPEQFGFAASDERTDVYALGVIFNEMMTGRFPQEQLAGGRYTDLIKQCVSMNPEDRPQTAAELRSRLYRKRYTIPGFRTGKWYKMMIAVLGYFVGIYMVFYYAIEQKAGIVDGWMLSVVWVFLFCWAVVFAFDYLGIRSRMTFLSKIRNDFLRLIATFGIWIIGSVVIFVFWTLVFAIVLEIAKA